MIPAYLEAGAGPALVFLHGVGGEAGMWQRQIAHFGVRFRAIAWDMPGHGRSPLLPETNWDSLTDALLRLLDDVAVEQAHLVGHSMGGMLAQYAYRRAPDRVASLVLAGTSAAFGSSDGSFQRQFLAERLDPLDAGQTLAALAPAQIAAMVAPDADPTATAEAVAALGQMDPAAYRAVLHCLATFDNRSHIGEIAVPTLLLAGALDRAAPPPGMERMAARIPGSRFVCLPECGHFMNLEQPAAFNAVLDEFYLPPNEGG